MSINLSALMKQRYDTAANWTGQNPTLLAGEIGIESDTKKWKVGTGATAWTSLAYAIGGTYPIVNADIAAAAAIVDTKLATIATALKVSNSATTAASANTASAIVARDASGNFTAGTITAALTGVASGNLVSGGALGTPSSGTLTNCTFPTLNQSTTGNAATVTTNANLTGDVTSVGNATAIAAGVIVNADINASAAIQGSKIVAATTAVVGAVQLSDSTSTTSSVLAATPTAVKAAYDLANAALPKAGGAMTGDITLNAQSDLRFADADSSNWVAFQAPTTVAANVTWTLPATDASVSGYALKSDGSGQLSWGLAGGALGSGANQIFYENDQTVTGNYSITAGKNAMTAGPVTVNSGVTVTVPTGSFWSII